MTRLILVSDDGSEQSIEAADGLSVMEVLRAHEMTLEGECEGSLACATCHVCLDPVWNDRLGEPSDEEADMLDFVFNAGPTSRLSCQIIVSPEIDGLRLRVPSL